MLCRGRIKVVVVVVVVHNAMPRKKGYMYFSVFFQSRPLTVFLNTWTLDEGNLLLTCVLIFTSACCCTN